MNKFFNIAIILALAFLSGCATNEFDAQVAQSVSDTNKEIVRKATLVVECFDCGDFKATYNDPRGNTLMATPDNGNSVWKAGLNALKDVATNPVTGMALLGWKGISDAGGNWANSGNIDSQNDSSSGRNTEIADSYNRPTTTTTTTTTPTDNSNQGNTTDSQNSVDESNHDNPVTTNGI